MRKFGKDLRKIAAKAKVDARLFALLDIRRPNFVALQKQLSLFELLAIDLAAIVFWQ